MGTTFYWGTGNTELVMSRLFVFYRLLFSSLSLAVLVCFSFVSFWVLYHLLLYVGIFKFLSVVWCSCLMVELYSWLLSSMFFRCTAFSNPKNLLVLFVNSFILCHKFHFEIGIIWNIWKVYIHLTFQFHFPL